MYGLRPVNRFGSGHWAHDDRGMRFNRYFVGRDRNGYYTAYPEPFYTHRYNRSRGGRRFTFEDDVIVDDDYVPVPRPRRKVSKKLDVKSVDFHITKNAQKHNTDKYEATQMDNPQKCNPVLRRGQSFRLTVTFDKSYDREEHKLEVRFKIGKHGSPRRGTGADIPVREKAGSQGKSEWSAIIKDIRESIVDLDVYIPATCVIGGWDCSVVTIPKDPKRELKDLVCYNCPSKVYILLNPWCEADTVYMPTERGLREYILNESGGVFSGNSEQIGVFPWNFAQFEKGILEICLLIIKRAFNGKIDERMGDPIKLSRAISQIVNNNDDGGVLIGRWDGNYADGERPTHWCGSASILKKYYEKNQSVKYGQCWVFSAITTTVCRTIGLPCRSVTNYTSAHDSNGNLTIDRVVERDPKTNEIVPCAHQPEDSIWNFHVWNDVWMRRPDLEGYDGWQAIDATPQERSDGIMRCGPAPLKAIKNGHCDVPYDTGFVFASINGDRVWWEKLGEGDYKVHAVDTKEIGTRMSTKDPNGKTMGSYHYWEKIKDEVNILDQYKYPEGSSQEEAAVKNASRLTRHVRRTNPDVKKQIMDVKIICPNDVMIGSDFIIRFLLTNHARTSQIVTFTAVVEAVSYTDKVLGVVKTHKYDNLRLDKKGVVKLKLPVSVAESLKYTDEFETMRVTASALIHGKDDVAIKQTIFRLHAPELIIQAPKSCKVREEVEVFLSLTNPLPIPLRNCSYGLEGYGNTLDIRQRDVPAHGEWKHRVIIKPTQIGRKQITGSFDCRELPEIFGHCAIDVENPYTRRN